MKNIKAILIAAPTLFFITSCNNNHRHFKIKTVQMDTLPRAIVNGRVYVLDTLFAHSLVFGSDSKTAR
ncbi:MAG: hypothetical protein JWP67_3399 [Mucilaginibacter sp.]|nr:hypothetical protein [Mucilaginibacter sp.]